MSFDNYRVFTCAKCQGVVYSIHFPAGWSQTRGIPSQYFCDKCSMYGGVTIPSDSINPKKLESLAIKEYNLREIKRVVSETVREAIAHSTNSFVDHWSKESQTATNEIMKRLKAVDDRLKWRESTLHDIETKLDKLNKILTADKQPEPESINDYVFKQKMANGDEMVVRIIGADRSGNTREIHFEVEQNVNTSAQ